MHMFFCMGLVNILMCLHSSQLKDIPPPILSPYVQVMEVLEGTRLTLACSTVIICPSIQPLMNWNPQLGEQLTPALQVKK